MRVMMSTMRYFPNLGTAFLAIGTMATLGPVARAQVFAEQDFESGAVAAPWDLQGAAEISTARAHSGRYAMRITYPAGSLEVNGHMGTYGAPVLTPEHTSFHIRWYEYFEGDFDFPNGLKRWRLHSDSSDGPMCTLETQYRNGRTIFDSTPGGGVPEEVLEAPPATTSVWTCYESEVTLNDLPDTRNGIFRMWVDDALVAERTNVFLRSSTQSPTHFVGFWIGGNYSDASGDGMAAVDSTRYIDDVVIAGSYVGCGEARPDGGMADAGSDPAPDAPRDSPASDAISTDRDAGPAAGKDGCACRLSADRGRASHWRIALILAAGSCLVRRRCRGKR